MATDRHERRKPNIVVVDRQGIAQEIEAIADRVGAPIVVTTTGSVLEVLRDGGPTTGVAGVVATTAAAGPFLQDLLRWTDREHDSRLPTLVLGGDNEDDAIQATLGREHVRWANRDTAGDALVAWLALALEVYDLRMFVVQHEAIAAQLREIRMRLFYGEVESFPLLKGPPCGPPLPVTVEEIQSLKDAKAQFERGLIRAAVRESGSLKDASAALGISYTSLWRRMR